VTPVADILARDAVATARSKPTIRCGNPAELTIGRVLETAELHRLYPRDSGGAAAEPGDAAPALEFEALHLFGAAPDKRNADRDTAIDQLRRRLATADEDRRATQRRASSREIELLREMLVERDKRIADRDAVIDELRRRLAATDEERRTIARELMTVAIAKQGRGLLSGMMTAVGSMLDVFAGMARPPPPPPPLTTWRLTARQQQRRSEHDAEERAARAVAETALLEQIAHHHLRWVSRDGAA
jgi:hypothetical protein